MKRIFDIIVAIVGLSLFLPLLALFGSVIWIGDKGSILYKSRRIGRYGQPFELIKFRTMIVNAEQLGGPTTSDDDPRLTKIGRYLRRFKIDEIPQLFNVVKGEMSLVGPRPEIESEFNNYTVEQRRVLELHPGITDYASIWNIDESAVLAGEANPHLAYKKYIQPTKLELQLKYLREGSFWLDAKIILYTIKRIIFKSWLPPELRKYPPPGARRQVEPG